MAKKAVAVAAPPAADAAVDVSRDPTLHGLHKLAEFPSVASPAVWTKLTRQPSALWSTTEDA
jgi:hypothetical protein